MNKFSEVILWVLTDLLLAFGITFIPSLFSIFCIILAIFLMPIEGLRKVLKKIFKKPLNFIVYLLCAAVMIIQFPLTRVINGIDKVLNPPPSSDALVASFKNYRTFPSDVSFSSDISSKKDSSYQNSNSKNSALTSNTTSAKQNEEIKNSDNVYRTPSGKRYHFSKNCGGQNSYEISFGEAVNDGLTPCKKCTQ